MVASMHHDELNDDDNDNACTMQVSRKLTCAVQIVRIIIRKNSINYIRESDSNRNKRRRLAFNFHSSNIILGNFVHFLHWKNFYIISNPNPINYQ